MSIPVTQKSAVRLQRKGRLANKYMNAAPIEINKLGLKSSTATATAKEDRYWGQGGAGATRGYRRREVRRETGSFL